MKNSIYLNVANLESRGSPAGEYRPSSFPKTRAGWLTVSLSSLTATTGQGGHRRSWFSP